MIKNIGKALILLLLLNLLLILPSFAGEKSDSGVDIQLDAYSADIQGQKSVDKKVYNKNIQRILQKRSPSDAELKGTGTVYEREPNDTTSYADTISIGDGVFGTMSAYNDLDVFKIYVPEDGALELAGLVGSSDYSDSQYLRCGLFSSSGGSALKWSSTWSTSSGYVQYFMKHVTAGTYYIMLQTWDESTSSKTSLIDGQPYMFATNLTTNDVRVTGVELDCISSTMEMGATAYIGATIYPSNATNQITWWSSSNEDVVYLQITNNGPYLTAVGAGTARIAVKTDDGDYIDYCDITVTDQTNTDIHPTAVILNKESTTINRGSTETLIATIEPSNATNKDVLWDSSNTSVATVDDGIVTAVGAGSASITVTTVDGSKTDTCYVTVPTSNAVLVSVVIDPSVLSLEEEETSQLTLIGKYKDNTTAPISSGVTWVSANKNIAKVDSTTGMVTAIGEGRTIISAKYNGKTATCAVTVEEPYGELTATPDEVTISVGENTTIRLTFSVDGIEEDVTDQADWESDDAEVASVSEGTITGVTEGYATITASYDGEEVYVDVTVEEASGEIIVTPDQIDLQVGATKQLKVQFEDENGKKSTVTKNCEYVIEDEDVATVDLKGKVKAVGRGETYLTVYYDDLECQVDVNVTAVPKSISVDPTNVTLVVGDTEYITVTGIYADGEEEDFTDEAVFSTSNKKVCYVEDGEIYAEGKGTAKITVKVGKLKKTISVKVTE